VLRSHAVFRWEKPYGNRNAPHKLLNCSRNDLLRSSYADP